MNLFHLITRHDLDKAISEKLVNVRDDGAGLRILNYTDAAMYTPGAWDNPAVRQCRGIIVDQDWNVVARPWAKFFNHGQAEAGVLNMLEPVEVTDKLDGSLGIIHVTASGQPRVATRGSFESDQAIHATAVLHARYPDLANLRTVTPLVEIIYPGNRIVVDYDVLDDLVLLGGVGIEPGSYYGPRDTAEFIGWTGPQARTFAYSTLAEAIAAPPRPGMEGLCVRSLWRDHIVKIKQDDYVALHRIVTGLSERTVWDHMVAGLPLNDLLGPLPDELHQWTREVWDRIDLAACSIEGRAYDAHNLILDQLPAEFERGEYARLAKDRAPLTPLLFNLLDGRDLRPAILKTLRPFGDTRAKAISEAVA